MDLRRVEMFLKVVDAGTFAAAADELGFVQSTISAGVHTLERELGVLLFDRSARAASLTAAGQALVPEARALLARAAQTRLLVREADRSLAGELRIGVIASTRPVLLPESLARMHTAHPQLSIRVLSDAIGTSNLVDRLRRSELDMIVASGHLSAQQEDGLVVERLSVGDLVCIVQAADELARTQSVRLADIAGRSWIEAPAGQANRATTDEAFRREGLRRSIGAEIADPTEVPGYVAAGLGVAIVPDFLAADHPGLHVLTVSDCDLQWSIAVIRLASRFSETMRVLWDDLVATSLRAPGVEPRAPRGVDRGRPRSRR